MRKWLSLFLLLLAAPVAAEDQRTFLRTHDINTPTESADNDQIVVSVNLTNTTFTIAAQPDVPRNITITVTDTTPSINAGTVTVTGTDVNGNTITDVLTLSSALTLTSTQVYASVTSVIAASAAVLGGAGDETIIVGTGSVIAYQYCSTEEGRNDREKVRNASSSATITAADTSTRPFQNLAAGDELSFLVAGSYMRRKIATWTDGGTVVLDSAIDLSGNGTVGYPFTFKDLTCGNSDTAGWVNTDGLGDKTFYMMVHAMSATGGLDYSLECRGLGDASTPSQLVAGNVTSAITVGVPSTTFAPVLIPETCASVRVGLKYGTTDTSGTDSISAYLRSGQE